ncbi:hypothetical protein [Paenibacillus algorifonticola]|uniref:hypothetical protein n=1 Tax=Paenibacillus algorifonticola TaxID=684063 RepID=UPI00094224D7|nr:hypothetical protein [Paenibacillus algorifonticola]
MYDQIKYLTHKGFAYFLRVENVSSRDIESTVRIFIAPEQNQEDYRSWIEIDKFVAKPSPGKNVIYQNSKESSVIQKPAALEPNPERTQGESGCQCGWPYTLLLPRGNEEGMPYVMMVMLTDWNEDRVRESTCGSISFCGVTNQNQPYPDSRALGYPFDRPIAGIANTLITNPHMATRAFKIRHLGTEG